MKNNDPTNKAEALEDTSSESLPVDKSKRYKRLGIGMLIGAVLGFSYYYFIGCQSGGCPITSNPLISTGYGAVFGAVISWK